MQPVVDRIFMITVSSFVNMYVIVAEQGLAIVDTGTSPVVLKQLEYELVNHGFGLYAINHILITHAHNDHVGGLPAIQEVLNAPTYAHRREAQIIRGEQKQTYANPEELEGVDRLMSMIPMREIPTARVDVELHGDETLDAVLPGLKVVELPGHSSGQIGFWWESKKLLIGADALTHLPWGLRMPFRAASSDWPAAIKSIRKIADLGVETLLVGHGSPIVGGASAKIRQVATRMGA